MKTILLTGSTGLVGRHLLNELASDHKIYAASRARQSSTVTDNVEYIVLNLNEQPDLSSLPRDLDAIIYLAQSEYFRDFPEKALDIFQVNTLNVLRLLDFARTVAVRTFIYASSGGVYGFGREGFSEDIDIPATGDLGFYLSTKLCSEILAQNYQQYMNVVLLRFFFMYGKGQKRSMLIPRLVDNVRSGIPITLQGNEGILINPTHVSDAVAAIRESLRLDKSEIFNIGGPDILSLKQICHVIGDRVGKAPVFNIDRKKQPNHLIGDISKMEKYLWKPIVSFEKGIESVL